MDLELQQIDRRYDELRIRSPRREEKLLASIADHGQLVPVAAVRSEKDPQRFVLIDGFKRLRALRRLRHDTVSVLCWGLGELDALLLCRSLRASDGETSLEQAWLLDELRRRFGLTHQELARQFERSGSWVSRRLALIHELPRAVQQAIREGRVLPHAATKYLVPMARENRAHCNLMARAIAEHGFTSRDVGQLYSGWRTGGPRVRARLLRDPVLYLRARRAAESTAHEPSTRQALLKDVSVLAAVARRAQERLAAEPGVELATHDRDALRSGLHAARGEIDRLLELLPDSPPGESDARPQHAGSDPRAEEARPEPPPDRADAADLAGVGPARDRVGVG